MEAIAPRVILRETAEVNSERKAGLSPYVLGKIDLVLREVLIDSFYHNTDRGSRLLSPGGESMAAMLQQSGLYSEKGLIDGVPTLMLMLREKMVSKENVDLEKIARQAVDLVIDEAGNSDWKCSTKDYQVVDNLLSSGNLLKMILESFSILGASGVNCLHGQNGEFELIWNIESGLPKWLSLPKLKVLRNMRNGFIGDTEVELFPLGAKFFKLKCCRQKSGNEAMPSVITFLSGFFDDDNNQVLRGATKIRISPLGVAADARTGLVSSLQALQLDISYNQGQDKRGYRFLDQKPGDFCHVEKSIPADKIQDPEILNSPRHSLIALGRMVLNQARISSFDSEMKTDESTLVSLNSLVEAVEKFQSQKLIPELALKETISRLIGAIIINPFVIIRLLRSTRMERLFPRLENLFQLIGQVNLRGSDDVHNYLARNAYQLPFAYKQSGEIRLSKKSYKKFFPFMLERLNDESSLSIDQKPPLNLSPVAKLAWYFEQV